LITLIMFSDKYIPRCSSLSNFLQPSLIPSKFKTFPSVFYYPKSSACSYFVSDQVLHPFKDYEKNAEWNLWLVHLNTVSHICPWNS
jgi:hypothetical protein